MANPAWYNDNQFRDYPFLTQVSPLLETTGFSSSSSAAGEITELPHSVIVDFGAIMEIDANYTEEAGHYVYLHSISRTGSSFSFQFRTNAPDASNHQIVFLRNSDDEFVIEWEDASTITPEELPALACPIEAKWKGFLVTGDLSPLTSLIADGETLHYFEGLWQVEPARVQSLMDSYLRAVTLANLPRVTATLPGFCSASSDSSESSAGEDVAVLNASCLVGDIKWKEGYNCVIRQDVTNNAIVIGAGVGVGDGEPCEEVPLNEAEAPPTGSRYLSGGPGCGDIIKAINGVPGPNVSIIAGPGFRVFADPDNAATLVINRGLDDFAICVQEDTVSSSSLSSASGGA